MSKEYQDINSKQTILAHCEDVALKFKELLTWLKIGDSDNIYQYPIPKWLMEYKDYLLPIYLDNEECILTYLLYHDCGKPFCLSVDSEGKRHFPNHSDKSKETFLKHCDNKFIAELIGKDMLCHLTKPKDFLLIAEDKNIEILLGSALAALHSNALMFGGFESENFKIKFNNLEKLGSRILKHKTDKLLTTKENINEYEFI